MDIPDRILFAAQRLKAGHRVNRLTVRDFLSHFGAERRGAVKVQAIREVLDYLGVRTDPDFETAWIDEPMWLRLRNAEDEDGLGEIKSADSEIVLEKLPPASPEEPTITSGEPETPSRPEVDAIVADDPTFRIGSLPAANRKLIVVGKDADLTTAVTLMLQYDYSQLPVMQGEREVRGVVTWRSIGARLALGQNCCSAGDFREDARIIDANRTLFEAIPIIVEFGYVLVRNEKDRRITGIVTSSDLSLQFQELSEPFLLLREIELHIRRILAPKIVIEDFGHLSDGQIGRAAPTHIEQLSLGQYVRLFQHPSVWQKLELSIDNKQFITLLDAVREIRNDVMHFDRDPMTKDQLDTLKRAARFMQQLNEFA